MKSYASIDRIEGKYAVCEVEMIGIEESKPTDFNKETKMMEFLLKENWFSRILNLKTKLKEGDIIVVEHDGEKITKICNTDNAEKQRRIEVLKAIME